MIMRRSVALAAVGILLIAGFAVAGQTRSDALVAVLVRGTAEKRAGTAFFIGDGSLAVTARHIVYGNDQSGVSESLGMVSLVSPYLGDECEAQIVAEDRELDLVVLRSSWKGHPVLELADEQAIMAATALEVESRIETVRALVESDLGTGGLTTQSEQLPVDYIGTRAGQTRVLAFSAAGKVVRGWSGSAVFLPGTSKVAGCLSSVGLGRIVDTGATHATAFSMEQVRAVLKREGMAEALQARQTTVRTRDAEQGLRLILQFYAERDPEKDIELAKQLIARAPGNAVYHVMAATRHEKLHHPADAEACYRKALEVDPHSAEAHVFYAQFLTAQKRLKEAMPLLEDVRRTNPRSTIWAIGMCNILDEQSDHAACVKVAQDALAITPRDAALLVYLGQAQKAMGDHAAAVTSLRRAMELGMDMTGLHLVLGGELEAIGSLDEAEAQFRLVKEKTPSEAMSHFLLANFIAKHRPAKVNEAIAELEQALSLPGANDGPLAKPMRDMLQGLKRHAATQPALHL
jgi:tetratricopeptide (TPR) repeat protein